MKSIIKAAKEVFFLVLIVAVGLLTILGILSGIKAGVIGVKNYVVAIVSNEPVNRGLPEGIVENEVTAELCAQSLEEQYPSNWYIEDLRRCVDRNNGYSDLNGNTIHPFS